METQEQVFRFTILGGGVIVLTIMLLIGFFLATRAAEALALAGMDFFTVSEWNVEGRKFGITAILMGTVQIGLIAMCIAFPLAFGTSLYISEYAPERIKRVLINLVDLMAAVPSVVYGLWGLFMLMPDVLAVGVTGDGIPRWLATNFGWFPFFEIRQDGTRVDVHDPNLSGAVFTRSSFVAGVVVAMMVTPIACSIMRENFSQAPMNEREGAYALGATKWGMVRAVVLPFGVGGMIGGTMLGLGRALGETIAVLMCITFAFQVKVRVLEQGTASISALIASKAKAATSSEAISALMAAGLVLFLMTLVVNFLASMAVARSRSGAVSDG